MIFLWLYEMEYFDCDFYIYILSLLRIALIKKTTFAKNENKLSYSLCTYSNDL